MYINVGAYVGDGTLVDSHALVGSCAQIGKRVHISAAAQIGGVIEPVGAMPVIIEDDVLVGGNAGIYEGAIVKTRAVLASGDDRHRVDAGLRPAERADHQAGAGPAAGDPRGRGRRAGRARGDGGCGQGMGPVARHAGHREVPRREDRRAHRARAMDPVHMTAIDPVALTRSLVDIDSTTGREGEAARGSPRFCASAGTASPSSRSPTAASTSSPQARAPPAGRLLHALRLRPAVLSEPARSAASIFGRGVLRCEGDPGGAGRRRRAAARDGRDAVRAAVRGRRGARQRRRARGQRAARLTACGS